jgi:hypothetical protein
MTWVRLDVNFPTHPKVLQAGPNAAWLYIAGLCWSHSHATDGSIPRHVLSTLLPDPHRARASRRLVEARLWHETAEGFEIHDYKDWQWSRFQKPLSSRPNDANGGVDLAHRSNIKTVASRAQPRAGARARAGGRRTEQKRVEPPPTPPLGGNARARDLQAYRAGCVAYAAEHFPGLWQGERAVEQATSHGGATTLEQVQAFVEQWWTKP